MKLKKHRFKRVVALMVTVSVLVMTGCSKGEDTKDNTEIATTVEVEKTTVENVASITGEESTTTQIESTTEETTTTQEVTTTEPPTTTQEVTTTQKKIEPQSTTQKQTENQTIEQPVVPQITASSTSITLTNSAQIVYITGSVGNENFTLERVISDSKIITCQWGEWGSGDSWNTIPLYIYPVNNGNANVRVYIQGTNKYVDIAVVVNMPIEALTTTQQAQTTTQQETTTNAADISTFIMISDMEKTYAYTDSRLNIYTKSKVESIEFEATPSYDGKFNLKIKLLVKKVYQGNYSVDNIKIAYSIYRDNIGVKTGQVLITDTELDTLYEYTISCSGLTAGNYEISFGNP